ncbi:MAG: hypothetical protein CMN18_10440 [Roseovarius sp.]|nr:hypothetical protein [Roseovarius sp.]MBD13120.1 hypothetical protein [Roseovarius sp.]
MWLFGLRRSAGAYGIGLDARQHHAGDVNGILEPETFLFQPLQHGHVRHRALVFGRDTGVDILMAAAQGGDPGLKLIIRDAAPTVLQEELLEGRHDLILAQLPLHSGDIAVERLFREPLKLVVAQDHPLAVKDMARDEDLTGQDILALPRGYPLHAQMVALCEEVGAQLRQDYEGSSLDALRQMTALNMGICFLPALYVQSEVAPETGDVAILSFRRDRFLRSVGVAWRRRSAHGPMVEQIVRVIRDVARDRFAGLVRLE